MSHRHKNQHKARHRTHAIKPQSQAKYAPGPRLNAIGAPLPAAAPPAPITESIPPAHGVEL